MTNARSALIAVLLDRSGSMETIKSDTEGGFDAFIDAQRDDLLDVRVTLAQFDTSYEVVYANRPLREVPPLTLQPRGMTALYDSVGKLTTDIGAQLAALPEQERPGRVIVVVLTDGHENSSREWTHTAVRAAITRQETDYNWKFIFLGANMDAVAIGEQMGFAADSSMTYAADEAGVAGAWRSTAEYAARITAAPAGVMAEGFSDEDRRAARGT